MTAILLVFIGILMAGCLLIFNQWLTEVINFGQKFFIFMELLEGIGQIISWHPLPLLGIPGSFTKIDLDRISVSEYDESINLLDGHSEYITHTFARSQNPVLLSTTHIQVESLTGIPPGVWPIATSNHISQ